jgi:hypothetical protein
MTGTFRLGILLCLGAAVCLGESWSGKLVDAACADHLRGPLAADKTPPPSHESIVSECPPTRSTTTFAIALQDGRVLRLDSTGNAKAADMLAGAGHRKSAGRGIDANVSGTLEGRTIRVESLDIE